MEPTKLYNFLKKTQDNIFDLRFLHHKTSQKNQITSSNIYFPPFLSLSLDILFNCAGQGFRGLALDTPLAVHREVMELNFFSQIRMVLALGKVDAGWKEKGHLVQV